MEPQAKAEIQVTEFRDYKSVRALNALSALLFGISMMPPYQTKTYEEFLDLVAKMEPEEQRKLITNAVRFVELGQSEVEALVSHVNDKNGVPIGRMQLRGMQLKEITDIMVSVCLQLLKIEIDSISEDQKKK